MVLVPSAGDERADAMAVGAIAAELVAEAIVRTVRVSNGMT